MTDDTGPVPAEPLVPGLRPVRGVLLDVDGTLVDSNLAHAEAWHAALTEEGLDPPPVERILRLIGMGGDNLLPTAVGLTEDSPAGTHASERRGEIFRGRYLPHLEPTRGARELVVALEDRGFRVAIATSAKPDELRAMLRQTGLPESLADRAASADEVASSKPDPDVVRAALDEIGLERDEVVLVGDTPYDIEAGARAGVWVIAVRCGGWDDDGLRGAVATFDDPADLLAHLDDTPIGAGQRDGAGATPG